MSSGAGPELPELFSLAMVIAVSPLSIIPGILVLQSPRPRPSGLMFLAGWVIGLAALTAVFIGVSGLVGTGRDHPPTWTSWARIVVGAALIAFGVFRWLTRHSKPHQIPGTRHITEAGPVKAFVVGAALTVVNPKVLFICLAAGLAIGSEVARNQAALAGAFFVAVSASTVALPILAYVLSGNRLDPTLERIKAWMERHNAALVAAILVVIGVLVLYKGIHGL